MGTERQMHGGPDASGVAANPLGPGEPSRASLLLAEVLRGSIRTAPPASLARDRVVGAQAELAFNAALAAIVSSEPAVDLLLALGMRASFLAPSVDTALMVAIVGVRRGWSDERLVAATIGAFLADVGMLRLGDDAHLSKPGPLSPAEREIVRAHPQMGAELLATIADQLEPTIVEVALQHHERVDGGGYPRGLSGAEVLEEAQAVGIAHLYTAATQFRSYRDPLPPAKAMALIDGLAGRAWDPRLVRAFVDGINPYPVGTLVRLSSGECACVVHGGESLRPLVEIRWNAEGLEIDPRRVPVSTSETGLRVVAVGG